MAKYETNEISIECIERACKFIMMDWNDSSVDYIALLGKFYGRLSNDLKKSIEETMRKLYYLFPLKMSEIPENDPKVTNLKLVLKSLIEFVEASNCSSVLEMILMLIFKDEYFLNSEFEGLLARIFLPNEEFSIESDSHSNITKLLDASSLSGTFWSPISRPNINSNSNVEKETHLNFLFRCLFKEEYPATLKFNLIQFTSKIILKWNDLISLENTFREYIEFIVAPLRQSFESLSKEDAEELVLQKSGSFHLIAVKEHLNNSPCTASWNCKC